MNKLLINEPPLQVLPSLAVAVGLNEAIVLQQVHYWLRHSKHEYDGRRWIYNTYEGWQSKFPFWSLHTVRRVINTLEERGLLLSRDDLNRMKIDRTKWYTIDYAALERITELMTDLAKSADDVSILDNSEESNLDRPITRDFQETTTSSARGAEAPALNCGRLFEETFGFLPSPFIVGNMHALEEEYGAVALTEAMRTAALAGKRDLRYVEGILRRQQTGDTRPEQPAQKPEPERGRWI